MNTKKMVLASMIALGITSAADAIACSCPWRGPFVEVASDANAVVVTVRVEGYGPRLNHGTNLYEFMEVSVVESLAGEARQTIRVYGDTGALCRPYISIERFAPGAEYVVAIEKLSRPSSFRISNCGEYWLLKQGDSVHGRITSNKAETMSYVSLRTALTKRRNERR